MFKKFRNEQYSTQIELNFIQWNWKVLRNIFINKINWSDIVVKVQKLLNELSSKYSVERHSLIQHWYKRILNFIYGGVSFNTDPEKTEKYIKKM